MNKRIRIQIFFNLLDPEKKKIWQSTEYPQAIYLTRTSGLEEIPVEQEDNLSIGTVISDEY